MNEKIFLKKYYAKINNELISQYGYDSDPYPFHNIITDLYHDMINTMEYEKQHEPKSGKHIKKNNKNRISCESLKMLIEIKKLVDKAFGI